MTSRRVPTATILVAMAIALTWTPHKALCQEEGAKVTVPLSFMPQLSFEQRPSRGDDRIFTMAQVSIPEMDDFRCEVWCYEMRTFGTGEAEMQGDGSLLITHTYEDVTVKTHLVPEPGAVIFNVEASGPDPEQVRNVTSVNPCWQLRESDAFGNRGDFYDDFVSRCFIYTVRGFTLMKDTVRFPDTRHAPDEKMNVRPWVQRYAPIWRLHHGQSASWGKSTDRPIYSIIGCVSRDGKYLTAFGWPKSDGLGQGYHDCLHGGPNFRSFYDLDTNKVVCHGKFYFMQNDPQALLHKYLEDFPQPKPKLTITLPDRGDATVVHEDLPGKPVTVGLLEARGQVQPWGSVMAKRLGSEAGDLHNMQGWMHPYGEFVNWYLTVGNDSDEPWYFWHRPRVAGVEGVGWESVADEQDRVLLETNDGWVAGMIIEQTHATIAPGEEVTFRGRLRIFQGTPEELETLFDQDIVEWQCTRPFRLPIEDE